MAWRRARRRRAGRGGRAGRTHRVDRARAGLALAASSALPAGAHHRRVAPADAAHRSRRAAELVPRARAKRPRRRRPCSGRSQCRRERAPGLHRGHRDPGRIGPHRDTRSPALRDRRLRRRASHRLTLEPDHDRGGHGAQRGLAPRGSRRDPAERVRAPRRRAPANRPARPRPRSRFL